MVSSVGQAEIHALMEGLQDMVWRYDPLVIVSLVSGLQIGMGLKLRLVPAQITQTPVASLPTFPLSAFSTTTVKPPLGASFTYFSDISLLIQKSTDVFVMDAYERKMMSNTRDEREGQPGQTEGEPMRRDGQESRMVVEIIKNRIGASRLQSQVRQLADPFFRISHQRLG
jgi:hypothetical protein